MSNPVPVVDITVQYAIPVGAVPPALRTPAEGSQVVTGLRQVKGNTGVLLNIGKHNQGPFVTLRLFESYDGAKLTVLSMFCEDAISVMDTIKGGFTRGNMGEACKSLMKKNGKWLGAVDNVCAGKSPSLGAVKTAIKLLLDKNLAHMLEKKFTMAVTAGGKDVNTGHAHKDRTAFEKLAEILIELNGRHWAVVDAAASKKLKKTQQKALLERFDAAGAEVATHGSGAAASAGQKKRRRRSNVISLTGDGEAAAPSSSTPSGAFATMLTSMGGRMEASTTAKKQKAAIAERESKDLSERKASKQRADIVYQEREQAHRFRMESNAANGNRVGILTTAIERYQSILATMKANGRTTEDLKSMELKIDRLLTNLDSLLF